MSPENSYAHTQGKYKSPFMKRNTSINIIQDLKKQFYIIEVVPLKNLKLPPSK